MAHKYMLNLSFLFLLLAIGEACKPSGYIRNKAGQCFETDPECCEPGKSYPRYTCSPPVTRNTPATMTLNSFGGSCDSDIGDCNLGCDNQFHSNSELVVALSTGWYGSGSRCLKNIEIVANGRSVVAKVVDECDSYYGCDADNDYQKPCGNNIVDASDAVWKALEISASQVGQFNVTWSDI